MIVCSCDRISHTDFHASALANQDAIRTAKSLGAAAGIVFRDTHQERNCDGGEKRRCNTCVAHIRETIVEMGLRPRSELDEKNARFAAPECGNCACGKTFDLSPV